MRYAFDVVFDENATQEEVYMNSAHKLIQSVLDGYNCSIFAYGATGAGKTHTMMGNPEAGPGIMYLMMQELFEEFNKKDLDKQYQISLIYIEVYNENIRDLLADTSGLMASAENSPPGNNNTSRSTKQTKSQNQPFSLYSSPWSISNSLRPQR